MKRKLICQRHPALYFLSVWEKRIKRAVQWLFDRKKYAKGKSSQKLPFRIKKHQSVLLRKLGDSEMYLQHNKVKNLSIAIQKINGLLILPGETFSFCKLVGLPTKRKGYLEGMEISAGEARPGTGGGICQIANLIHWLVMHSPLSVVERHHHSFDPFPDQGRVLPFGSGAAVFYNYIDYQFSNNTDHTFQINLWLSEKLLEGDLRISEELPFTYHVYEDHHEFLKIGEKYFRKNEIWRKRIGKFTGGNVLGNELLTKNFAEVKYVPEAFK
jgi:vancomycin resistance protein VanW